MSCTVPRSAPKLPAKSARAKELRDGHGVNWKECLAPAGYVYQIPAARGPMKFAKVEPTTEECVRCVDRAESIIRHTRPLRTEQARGAAA